MANNPGRAGTPLLLLFTNHKQCGDESSGRIVISLSRINKPQKKIDKKATPASLATSNPSRLLRAITRRRRRGRPRRRRPRPAWRRATPAATRRRRLARTPSPASCCAQLGKVVRSDPQCLCVALSADPASLGLSVNRTRALGLPAACAVATPDVSSCKGAAAGPPATAPGAGTPAGQAPGGTGSKTTPATGSVPGAAAASPRGSSGAGLVAGFVAAAVLAAAAA